MPDEVRALVCEPMPDGITVSDLQNRLKTTHRVMQSFLALGVFKPAAVKNPVHGGIMKVVPMADPLEFERRYVSLMQLADENGRHFAGILKEIEARGVKPVWQPEVVRSRWYRREDVQ